MKLIDFIRRPIRYSFYNITIALIVINVGVFIINNLFRNTYFILGLNPVLVVQRGYFWQVCTYMFVHGGIFHLFFNMFGLLLFGSALERRLGSFEFLALYLVTGTATGLVALIFLGGNTLLVGASGALYALLLGYATLFPDSTVLMGFVIPVKAPIAVLIFTAVSIFFHFTDRYTGISHLAHLAGLAFGYLYFWLRLNMNPIKIFIDRYR
jgi:membrane associated rhomboid family serine protease